jgi:hypothetical protein
MQTFSKNDYDYDAREPRLLKRYVSIWAEGLDAIRILIPNLSLITWTYFNILILVLFLLFLSFSYYILCYWQVTQPQLWQRMDTYYNSVYNDRTTFSLK